MAIRVFERVVAEKSHGIRLDVYLVRSGIGLSRSQAEKLIKEGKVLVNGRPSKPGYRVHTNDHIVARFEVLERPPILAQDIPVPVVYEDDDIVVINKPVGMVVHPARGNLEGTLINALLAKYKDLPKTTDKTRPGVVHRLDKETSGLLVVAKTDRALRSLARQMEEKTSKRIYWAIVWGAVPQREGIIEAPIGRHSVDRKRMAVTPLHSRPAITEYRVLKRYDRVATWLEVSLKTGRTHQIRVHFEYLGYPIVGDPTYSGRNTRKIFQVAPPECAEVVKEVLDIIKRQALHAYRLSFIHPATGMPMTFEVEPPDDFQNLLNFLNEKFSETSKD
jgi:23S rRNA pseudouridine1911/1915/1917 synthase